MSWSPACDMCGCIVPVTPVFPGRWICERCRHISRTHLPFPDENCLIVHQFWGIWMTGLCEQLGYSREKDAHASSYERAQRCHQIYADFAVTHLQYSLVDPTMDQFLQWCKNYDDLVIHQW